MISAGEVGAVFAIENRASAQLKALMRDFDALQASIDETQASMRSLAFPPEMTRGIEALETKMTAVADASKAAGDEVAALFTKIDGSADTAAASIGRVATELRGVAAEAKAVNGSAIALGAGGGGRGGLMHRGGSGHISGPGVPLPGGGHLRLPGGPLMVAGAAVGYGAYLEGEFEDQAARMILTGQMNGDVKMTDTAVFKQIRETLQGISARTGYGPGEVGEAMLGVERQFAGQPLDKRLQIEETIAPYAAAEARLKETNFKESFEALVGLTHMTGTYDPEKLPELMRQFSYASLITPAPITSFRNALSYSLPILHAGLDMDPSSIMFLTAMMQTAGINNTKSGTWLRSFFERAAPPLDDTPASLKRLGALERMGLADDSRHQTWTVRGADGKTDWDASILKLSTTINSWSKKTDPIERIATLQAAFGERGGGFGALMNLPEFIGQFPTLEQKMRAFQGGGDVLDYMAKNSPMQQARQAWADMQGVLMDIGAIALPPVTAGLRALDAGLKDIKAVFDGTFAQHVEKTLGLAGGKVAGWFSPPAPHVATGRDPRSPSTGPYAYTPPSTPLTTTANVKVDVFVDSELVASRIMSSIESALRLPGSSAGVDGSANHMPPDAYNF